MSKLLFLIFTFIYTNICQTTICEIILTNDKNYEVIHFQIPKTIWTQALNPTPVLRHQATVVLPIHVANYDINDVEDEEEDVEVTEASVVQDAPVIEPIGQDAPAIETAAQDAPVIEPIGQDAPAIEPASQDAPAIEPVVQDELVNVPPAVLSNTTEAAIILEEETATQAPDKVNGSVFKFPCSCVQGQCGCCTGTIMERFKMKTCGNIRFVPEDFVFDVRMTVNNRTVLRRRVSADSPPPICFNPRRAPFIRICAEISNIRIRNRNAYACLDITADIAEFQVYSASFRCFGLGTKGVQAGLNPKPISSGPAPVSLFGNNDDDDDRDGFFSNVADGIFGGGGDGEGGLFGGGGGIFGGGSDDDDEGPFDAIGDAVGDLFDGRRLD